MKLFLTTQPPNLYDRELGSRLIPVRSKDSARVLLTLQFGESLSTPTRARLIVYDLDDYLTGPLGQQELSLSRAAGPLTGRAVGHADPRVRPWRPEDVGFFDGHLPHRPLPEALRDPPLEQGVLLKVDLKLNGKPATFPEKGWWWWAEEPKAVEHSTDEAGEGVEVVMWSGPRARSGKAPERVVGRIRYRKVDLTRHVSDRRRILLRFVCLQPSAPSVGPGTVFLSNLSKLQTLAPNPLYIETTLLKRERGIVDPPGPKPASLPRRLEPDLTGYYEEIPLDDPSAAERPDFEPAGFLHINQAGKARVGWYTPYAELGLTPGPKPLHRRRFVLRADPIADDQGQYPLVWTEPRTGFEDPTALLGEPFGTAGAPVDDWLPGTLEVVRMDAGLHVILRISGPGADGRFVTVERYFLRTTRSARLPWSVLRDLFKDQGEAGAAARRAVIAQQAEPMPFKYWLKVAEIVSQKNTDLVEAIQLFVDQSDSSSSVPRRVALAAASKSLRSVFVDGFWNRPTFAEHHIDQIRAQLRTFSVWQSITVKRAGDDVKKTVAQWLEDLLFWGLDWLVKKDEAFKDVPRAEVYPKKVLADEGWRPSFDGFVLAGVQTRGGHTYKLQFFALKGPPKTKLGLSFGVGGFALKVTRLDEGKERWSRRFAGVFAGLAAGIAFEGGLKDGGGVPGPGSVDIESFFAFEPDDFVRAPFRIVEVGGPSGGYPFPGAKLKTASSLFVITLEREDGTDIELSAITNDLFSHDLEPPDVKKYEKNDFFSASAQLFSIGMSFGILLLEGDPSFKKVDPPTPERPNVDVKTDPTQVDVLSFRVGSAELAAQQLALLDVRLATYRKLIEAPGFIHCLGYVSPEWKGDPSGEKNLKLSQARADAALDAIVGAVGAPAAFVHEDKELLAIGFGEDPATNPDKGGPLLDPENPDRYVPAQMTADEFRRRLADEEPQYPAWRRVDVLINGLVVVRLRQG